VHALVEWRQIIVKLLGRILVGVGVYHDALVDSMRLRQLVEMPEVASSQSLLARLMHQLREERSLKRLLKKQALVPDRLRLHFDASFLRLDPGR
jgi:hypothetical protein